VNVTQQPRAQRTRQSILEAAGQVFAENGFVGASVEEVLTRSNTTKGALYFHFRTKEDLAAAVIEEEETVADRIAERELVRDAPPLEVLISLSERWASEIQSNPVVRGGVRLIVERRADPSRLTEPYERWEKLVAGLMLKAQEQGDLRETTDPFLAAELLVAAFTGTQLMSHLRSGHRDLMPRVRTMLELLFAGFVPETRAVRFPGAVER
jgi:AcrR family transcriptional regulator